MAVVKINAYKDQWGAGVPITLYVPIVLYDANSATWPPYNGTFANLTNYPEYYDADATIFVPTWATNTPATYHNFIQIDDGITLFYISETNYFRFSLNSSSKGLSIIAYLGGNFVLNYGSNQVYGQSLPSFVRNELYANFSFVCTNELGTNYRRTIAEPTTGLINFWNSATIIPDNLDPYEQGGISNTGGGTGNFDLSSDAIDFPGLPTLSAVSTGLISLYTPTITQLNALASYLWNADVTTVDWWKKLVANPLDLILGLSIVPVAAPQGASNNIKVGLIDTGVSMPRCSSQYVEVDCGSLNVSEFWGSALDYAPFRKHSIYLPFIGTRSINTDDIMGKTVSVVYHIDLLSGAATAMIKSGDSVLYQYSGACAISVPLSGQTFTDMITSTIQLAAAIGATVATGGAAAGITAASAANSVMSMKPTIERAGGVSGAAGQLGIMTPYLIGEIPRQSVPENYNQFAGYPSNIKSVLGELSGYTEVETIYLTNIIATSGELGEIESLLKQGVFINES